MTTAPRLATMPTTTITGSRVATMMSAVPGRCLVRHDCLVGCILALDLPSSGCQAAGASTPGASGVGMSREPSPTEDYEPGVFVLPIPAGWTGRRLPLWLIVSVVMTAVIALALVAEAGWLVWRGQAAEGALLAAAAVYLGHGVGLGAWMWWPRRHSRRKGVFA